MRPEPPLLVADDLIPDRAIASVEEDAFGHRELARVVADVVRHSTGPLNVALFGAWGAGKSSFFTLLGDYLRPELEGGEVKLVRYDAWKYKDAALSRHFITKIASALDVSPPDLYSTEETQAFDPKRLGRAQIRKLLEWLLSWLPPVLLVGLAAYIGWSAVVAATSRATFIAEIEKIPAYVLAPTTVIAIGAVAVRLLFADAFVTRSRAAPSEEKLGTLFESVLEAARDKAKGKIGLGVPPRRFVFFIDELDRCVHGEVVATLSAIKNFLGQEECVFIVAADREVLEEALTELPQSNPANENAPYYSSASEFLDKIFQTQINFPPLREQRRTWFARDLVNSKETGLWHDLREREGGRALDDVIYALIPSHVQSPRRIKILLNNFAVNARRVQARRLRWIERATEIAKLTVFETEFPLFAPDLATEPRLPELLLLTTLPDDLPLRTRELVEKHELPPSEVTNAASAVGSESAPAEETDKLLVTNDDDRRRLAHIQRRQLRRYLETRRDFPNPSRDLLYLESIGDVVELGDPDLADLLELQAPEQPSLVQAAVANRDQETITKVVLILASLVPQNFGRQQAGVVRSLFFCAEMLDARQIEVTVAIADALARFAADRQELEEGELILALNVALDAGRTALVSQLWADDRLLDNPERVAAVASEYHRLPDSSRRSVVASVTEAFESDEEVLFTPLHALPEDDAVDLLKSTFAKTIGAALESELEGASEVAERLFWSLDDPEPRTRLLAYAEALLLNLDNADAYAVVRERAQGVLSLPRNHQFAARHALQALAQATPDDWDFWLALAKSAPAPDTVSLVKTASKALASVFEKFAAASEIEQVGAHDVVDGIIEVAPLTDDESAATTIADSITAATASAAWAVDAAGGLREANLHLAAWGVCRADHLRERVTAALADDLERAAVAPTSNALSVAHVTMLAPTHVIVSTARSLVAGPNTAADELLEAQLLLAGTIAVRGDTEAFSDDVFSFAPAEVMTLAANDRPVRDWLSTKPPIADVISAAQGVRKTASASLIRVFAGWAEAQSIADRTRLVLALIDTEVVIETWLNAFATLELDDAAIVDRIVELERQALRHEQRGRLADDLRALHPSSAPAQSRAAEFIIALLKRHTAGDFDTALRTISAVGNGHKAKRRLGDALREASDALKKQIPAKYAGDLDNIGIRLAQKYIAQPKKKGFRLKNPLR